MKTVKITFMAILAGAFLASCGGSKPAVAQDVAVIVPCTGPEYRTDKQYIRASGMGLSSDMTIARSKAMSNLRSEMAASVSSKVKAVTDHYLSSYEQGGSEESKNRFQSISRTVVEQELNGIRIICEQTMKTPENQYKVYVAAELVGKELMENTINRIKSDDKLKTDFEYEKFKKIFEEEMAKNN